MKITAAVLLPCLVLPTFACAAELGVGGTTLFRLEERSAPGIGKSTLAPATQFLNLDAEKLGDGNLSAHLFGWGRVDLADRSTEEGKFDGNLSHAYLSYRFPTANGEIRGGRFFLSEPGSFEYLDGVSARADLALKGMSALLYAGAPVKTEGKSENKGDYLSGGRLSYRYPGLFELGGALVREGGMHNGPSIGAKDYRQEVAADLWLAPFKGAELTGRTSYNTAIGGLSENSYRMSYQALKQLTLAATYNRYDLKQYFSASSIPSLFNPNSAESYSVYGGEASWVFAPQLEATLDYRHYQRDLTGESDRGGAEIRMHLLENTIHSGLSYHRSASAQAGINSYHEVRGYCLYNKAKLSASLDAITQLYDHSIQKKKSAYETVASLGYHIYPELALSGDLSFAANPSYDSEVKGLIRLVWNYQSPVKGAAK